MPTQKIFINGKNYLVIIGRIIKDCFAISEEQTRRKCYGDIYSKYCSENCIYYENRESSCVGIVENKRCDDCFLNTLNLSYLCDHAQKFYFRNRKER